MADLSIGQQVAAQLPLGSNLALPFRSGSPEDRLWYARQAIENGWSCDALAMQIDAHLVDRAGKAVNDLEQSLAPADSDMAIRVFKSEGVEGRALVSLNLESKACPAMTEDELYDYFRDRVSPEGRTYMFLDEPSASRGGSRP